MRLFVAAEIGETLASRVGGLIGELQSRVAKSAGPAKITWVGLDRLHITVRFIGEVEDAHAAAVRSALESPLGLAPFDLTLAGAGAFPRGGPPRVLWAGIEHGKDQLMAIERLVTSRLVTAGVPDEARAFNPHLTLARVRDAGGLRSASLLAGLEDIALGAARIDAITLFKSTLSPKGPAYVSLLQIPLDGFRDRSPHC